MSDVQDPIDPPLRSLCPRVCVQCDYTLAGLPLGGHCPECGLVEDPSVLTVTGWDRPPFSKLSQQQRSLTLVYSVLAAAYLFYMFVIERSDSIFEFAWVAIVVGPIVYPPIMAFIQSVSGPPRRLRFNAKGFERRIGPGPLKLHPWELGYRAQIEEYGPTLWQFATRWAGEPGLRPRKRVIWIYIDSTREQATLLSSQINRWIASTPPRPLGIPFSRRGGRIIAKAAASFTIPPESPD